MRSRNRKNYEVHGDVYFITSTVVGFIDLFDHSKACHIFADCLRFCHDRQDFNLLAWVLMPNHFHLLLKVFPDKNISGIIGSLKRYTSRQIGQLSRSGKISQTLNHLKRAAIHESGKGTAIWKPRFDCLVITSETTLRQKIEYIHNNPVRKGLAQETWEWPYSSAATYRGKGCIEVPVDTDWHCLGYDRMRSGKDS